jgi:oxygen-independent coproporphyrinogen-3 oxidase
MQANPIFNADLIRRYDKSGPRYTSYPTAVQFHAEFDETAYRRQAAISNARGGPLSLYFHIPFCDTVCFYCACNKVVTKRREKADPYLANLYRELELQSALFDSGRPVEQLHWGGGTPTFLSHAQMRELMSRTADHFALKTDDSGEYSIEIDPREADAATIALLRQLGFNRLSLGVQDFDPAVQKAVNRIQSEAETLAILEAARAEHFHGISVDLIYGLPFQTVDSFMRTLDTVIEASPDRLSVFNYAHLPTRFMPQRRINAQDLPEPAQKLSILEQTIARLTSAGYVLIGMDHFAKPDDPLAVAQREGSLYRNFQGYATHADCDLIGLGVSSIGQVGDAFSQNVKDLDSYQRLLEMGRLPIERGLEIHQDDRIRRAVITGLICHFEIDGAEIESRFDIDFLDYFADEIERLDVFRADGLLEIDGRRIRVHPIGRLMIRNICMTFDRYLVTQTAQRFSRTL